MKSIFNEKTDILITASNFLWSDSNDIQYKIPDFNNERKRILVVSNEPDRLCQLEQELKSNHSIILEQKLSDLVTDIEHENPDLIIMDWEAISNTYIEAENILEELYHFDPKIKLILICNTNVKFNKDINTQYLQYKDIEDIETLKSIISYTLYVQYLELTNEKLVEKLGKEKNIEDIIGDSPQMRDVNELIEKVTHSDAHVLILGETGTGKELIARTIHSKSYRKHCPFITVNCGAIHEDHLKSEFWGHEKGKFNYQKFGKLEMANTGTIFLYDVDKLSIAFQVQLLDFLKDKEIQRIGGTTPIQIDVRIIAATDSDLTEAIEQQRFRLDLFYRLSVVSIELPPLRNRGNDILLLANWFLNKYIKEFNKDISHFHADVIEKMMYYHWPGNVRELKNRIKRAVIMDQDQVIDCDDLGITQKISIRKESLTKVIDQVQKEYIDDALCRTRGNISQAAKDLGISRMSLYDMIHRFNFKVNEYRKL